MPPAAAGAAVGSKGLAALLFGTTAASTASSLYATKRAGSLNEKAIRAQQEEARQNAALERENRAAQERLYLAALDQDRQRWADYTRIMTPHWQVGASALGRLYGMAGMPGEPPTMTMPAGPPASGAPPTAITGTAVATAPTTTGPTYLDALPNSHGRTAAARRLRQVQPGLTPGMPMSSLSQLMALASLVDARGPQASLGHSIVPVGMG